MRRLFLMLACLLPLLAATACGDESPTSIEDTQFAAALGIDLSAMTRTNTGLYYRDLTVGGGAMAQGGSRVNVRYKGWLANGTMFEQGTYPFTLGRGDVIAGWDQGIAGMRVGGKRQLVIPASLGYGREGSGPIPGNAVMVFEVELLSVQ